MMPVIFASSLLAAPTALARYFPNAPAVAAFSKAVSPAGSFYLPVRCAARYRAPQCDQAEFRS